MLSYYKRQESYFKLDAEKTFFQQINNLPTEKTVISIQNASVAERLHEAKDRDAWTVITEQEYNTAKDSVLDYLSAN